MISRELVGIRLAFHTVLDWAEKSGTFLNLFQISSTVYLGLSHTVHLGWACYLFSFNLKIFQIIWICKIRNWYLQNSKKNKIWQVERLLHIEHIFFLAKLQNLYRFWITKFENKSTLNLIWILKGFKPSGKNRINPSKFNLHMSFKNMNLDWLTCIQEFGVPLQMINMTWFIKTKPYKIRIQRKK
jgi:hypothetical protein